MNISKLWIRIYLSRWLARGIIGQPNHQC